MAVLACLLTSPAAPAAEPAVGAEPCSRGDADLSIDDLVERIERDGTRYVFVGERHAIGPVKRFAVELANLLEARGHEVALYVEGFRADCSSPDADCWSLARWFNPAAFGALLEEARVPVRPIDPPERDARGARMAATIAAGSESVRIVLVGLSHVRHAGDPNAQVRVFGGAVAFADPGDVAEAFPREQTLTIGLDAHPPSSGADRISRLTVDGCEFDLRLTTLDTEDYWAESGESPSGQAPIEAATSEARPPTPAPEVSAPGTGEAAGSSR